MENMTIFILGIAILSAGTYLMRLGGAKLDAGWRCPGVLRRCCQMRQRYCCSPWRLATTFYEETTSPAWRACWAWRLRCFGLAENAVNRVSLWPRQWWQHCCA